MSPSSGGGTGTPIAGGAGPGLDLAQPYPYTLLSLPRYAQIMGLNPLHFATGLTPGLNPTVMPVAGCDDIWWKYDWQDGDKVSKMQLAQLIQQAEEEIANVVGYWPAPMWIEQEMHPYPRTYPPDSYGSGLDVRGKTKGFASDYGRFIVAGERAVTLVGTASTVGGSLVYSDVDGDGFFETATITLPTTLTNENEIKVYFTGEGGGMDWEIRPVRSKIISGGNIEIVIDSWLLVDPELYEVFPTSDGLEAINLSTVANFVTSVQVYREYNDFTQRSATFYWESSYTPGTCTVCPSCTGTGCPACEFTSQDGCLNARLVNESFLVASPGTYNVASARWLVESWVNCVEPDIVKIWYKAGDQDQRYLQGRSCDPLSLFWAQAIAWLATARLERPLCGCSNIQAVADDLREDLIHFTTGNTHFITREIESSPFGTRKGEVMAWRRVAKTVKSRRFNVAVI